MPSLRERLQLLSGQPVAAVVSILLDALPHAAEDERPEICQALAKTGDATALATLIRDLHRLDEATIALLGRAPGEFDDAIGRSLASGQAQHVDNVLQLIESRVDADLLTTLPRLFRSRVDHAPQRAAEVLLESVVERVGETGRRRIGEVEHPRLDAACAAALLEYRQHKIDEVLIAAAIMAVRPGVKLSALFESEDHPARFALHGVAERIDHPLVRRNLLRWLGALATARSAARWLHLMQTPEQYAEVLRDVHLLVLPERRRSLRRINRTMRCLPPRDVLLTMSGSTQAAIPRFVSALRPPTGQSVRYLEQFTTLPSRRARLFAVSELTRQRGRAADEAVLSFIEDTEQSVARTAVRHIFSRAAPIEHCGDTSGLEHVAKSRHRELAARASALLIRTTVKTYFEQWLGVSVSQRRLAARRLLGTYRTTFIQRLAAVAQAGDRERRLAAIDLCHRCRLVRELETEMIVLAADSDVHVASAAVAALTDGRSAQKIAVLRSALHHDDTRVRANAIEALTPTIGNVSGQVAVLIEPFMHSRENRTRANAIRAWLQCEQPNATVQLTEMLYDDDPMHRISALWAVGRSRKRELLTPVRELVESDPVLEIQVRAAATHRLLQSSQRSFSAA